MTLKVDKKQKTFSYVVEEYFARLISSSSFDSSVEGFVSDDESERFD